MIFQKMCWNNITLTDFSLQRVYDLFKMLFCDLFELQKMTGRLVIQYFELFFDI